MKDEIDYPKPPNQGKRREQYETAARFFVYAAAAILVIVICTVLWNMYNGFTAWPWK